MNELEIKFELFLKCIDITLKNQEYDYNARVYYIDKIRSKIRDAKELSEQMYEIFSEDKIKQE
jgi:hypothetical protein